MPGDPTGGDPTAVVERFLATFTSHDWAALRACLADDFTRTGPDGVVKASPGEFVDLLAGVLPSLTGHRVEVRRVTAAGGQAFAEFVECLDRDGREHRAPQCLVLELAADGRIRRLRTYMQRLGEAAGRRAPAPAPAGGDVAVGGRAAGPGPTIGSMSGIVERYLATMTSHDWDDLRACLADPFRRIGPYGDVKADQDAYVAFLSDLMPRLPNYSLDVHRVTYVDGRAFAELTESMDVDGRMRHTPEVLVFDLAPDGRISQVEIYIQRHGDPEEQRAW